jgi:hypothetical protein
MTTRSVAGATATYATFGPFQFIATIRLRFPAWHRGVGRVLLVDWPRRGYSGARLHVGGATCRPSGSIRPSASYGRGLGDQPRSRRACREATCKPIAAERGINDVAEITPCSFVPRLACQSDSAQ